MAKIKKVLIANRGEIALRVIRSCKDLKIPTVAVFSTADKNSPHVAFSNEAICIGPPASKSSYLKIPSIITAAEISGANAIHPGYGFLAENAEFAKICEESNIIFIGPSSSIIGLMGNKSEARKTMTSAGVPVVPGSKGNIDSFEDLKKIVKKIRYPIIIKASSGGGGKGMRIVRNDGELKNNFEMAKSESQNAFNDASVYVEKYIENPHHIEVQLLGDNYGNIVHIGERDCSMQRRHQKIVEESPSPILDDEKRKAILEMAIKGAREVKYNSAGTMEFIVDKDLNFYFMEMNTRIQVEHTVSEMRSEMDLIAKQIRIADGEKLKIKQKDINLRGHAIEVRINAENPSQGFMPSPGKIKKLNLPGGFGIRIDTFVHAGYEIPPHYDSMIAKLIVYGETRYLAINRLNRALDEFYIDGINTNISFLKELVNTPAFLQGNYNTHFVEEFLSGKN
ncbi:acetyl-CoA carboxylase biotin carboxylase subunit [bacterium]|nr:acetyl-CoA carboxylase biotin carboxylase subunit [bacterium]